MKYLVLIKVDLIFIQNVYNDEGTQMIQIKLPEFNSGFTDLFFEHQRKL